MNMNMPILAAREHSLGEGIYRARKARGWSLDKLAAEVGVSKPTVWSWERGRCNPRLPALRRLAAVLEVPLGQLQWGHVSNDASLPELIADCRQRIAQAAGVQTENVEIRVNFSATMPEA